jgi:hypothetical protein
VGDAYKVHAWGTYTNAMQDPGGVQVRLYFNPGATLTSPIADTVVAVIIAPNTSHVEWHFFAELTIRATGASGGGMCDSYLENVTDPPSFNAMAGSGSFPGGLDTTKANDFELTAQVSTAGNFELRQCTIERLASP